MMSTVIIEDNSLKEDERESTCDSVYNSPDGDFFDDPDKELKLFLSYSQENFNVFTTEENYYNLSINESLTGSCQTNGTDDLIRENLALKEKLIKLKTNEKYVESKTHTLEEKILETKQGIEDMSEEIQTIISEITHISLEIKEKLQKTKSTYNAYNFAGKYFKNLLEMYIEVEENDKSLIIKVYLFTTCAKNKTYSITLQKNKIESSWKLESTTPKLPVDQFKNLQDKLASDNDVIVVICEIRKKFKLIHCKNRYDKENTE